MSSERKVLRQDIVARLKASAAVTALCPAERVYDSRTTRIPAEQLPAVNVFVPSTRRRRRGPGVPVFEVRHEVGIDCYGKGETDAELSASVDELAAAVIEALLTDPDFVSQWEGFEDLDSRVALDADSEGRKGVVRITFEVVRVRVYEPALADDLKTVDVDVDVIDPATGAPDGTPEVEATFDGLDQ